MILPAFLFSLAALCALLKRHLRRRRESTHFQDTPGLGEPSPLPSILEHGVPAPPKYARADGAITPPSRCEVFLCVAGVQLLVGAVITLILCVV